MATATAKPKKQSSAKTNGRGSVNQRKGSSRATKQRQRAGNAHASTAKPVGRSARARPAAKRTAGRARPAHVAKRALKVASEAGGDGAGKFETLSAFWRVGRLAWRVARGKRPNAKQLRKAAASASEVAGKAIAKKAPQRPLRRLGELVRQGERLPEDIRRVPVQRSLDVAVPLEVAYEEWMQLDALPEGAHRVEHIKRRGGRLVGQVNGLREAQAWEAEIRDERANESFAWLSTRGSDVAGLITFHRLSERLTRLELQLDVNPTGAGEAAYLALHLADRRAETELRRFKSRVETISPDAYPSHTRTANRKPSKPSKKKED